MGGRLRVLTRRLVAGVLMICTSTSMGVMLAPMAVAADVLPGPQAALLGVPIPIATSVATGDAHACALLLGGTVACWGRNDFGQLGDGTTTERHTPVAVTGLSGVTAIAAGGFFTCALLAGGTVVCWGWNVQGQLGDGTTTDRYVPVAVGGLSGVTARLMPAPFLPATLVAAGDTTAPASSEMAPQSSAIPRFRASP
jgi:hypothetical protein